MRYSNVFAAALVAPLVAAHGGDTPGAPKLFGLKNLRARNPWAGHKNAGSAAGPKFQARQGGNAEGRCGADGGGASCAAGFCCSTAVSLLPQLDYQTQYSNHLGLLWCRH
jgi:hypothetical protein